MRLRDKHDSRAQLELALPNLLDRQRRVLARRGQPARLPLELVNVAYLLAVLLGHDVVPRLFVVRDAELEEMVLQSLLRHFVALGRDADGAAEAVDVRIGVHLALPLAGPKATGTDRSGCFCGCSTFFLSRGCTVFSHSLLLRLATVTSIGLRLLLRLLLLLLLLLLLRRLLRLLAALHRRRRRRHRRPGRRRLRLAQRLHRRLRLHQHHRSHQRRLHFLPFDPHLRLDPPLRIIALIAGHNHERMRLRDKHDSRAQLELALPNLLDRQRRVLARRGQPARLPLELVNVAYLLAVLLGHDVVPRLFVVRDAELEEMVLQSLLRHFVALGRDADGAAEAVDVRIGVHLALPLAGPKAAGTHVRRLRSAARRLHLAISFRFDEHRGCGNLLDQARVTAHVGSVGFQELLVIRLVDGERDGTLQRRLLAAIIDAQVHAQFGVLCVEVEREPHAHASASNRRSLGHVLLLSQLDVREGRRRLRVSKFSRKPERAEHAFAHDAKEPRARLCGILELLHRHLDLLQRRRRRRSSVGER